MRILTAIVAGTVLLAGPVWAGSSYAPPEGCEAIATLHLRNCLVRQVSRCAKGNVQDSFHEGVYTGRAYYTHPALFVRYEGVDGFVTGHNYGAGAPDRSVALVPGRAYRYTREVYRNAGGAEPGDTGTEVMEVGARMTIALEGRDYRVLDIRFDVTNAETGYRYRERAFVLENPGLTIGIIGSTTKPDGTQDNVSTIPESISLPGDPGFLSNEPAVSCLPST